MSGNESQTNHCNCGKCRDCLAAKRGEKKASGLCVSSGCMNTADHGPMCTHCANDRPSLVKDRQQKKKMGLCIIIGCESPVAYNGMCAKCFDGYERSMVRVSNEGSGFRVGLPASTGRHITPGRIHEPSLNVPSSST